MNMRINTKGSGPARAADGLIHDRKLAAWLSFALGAALLVQGTFVPPSAGIEAKVVPAIVAFCFSLLFWGLVTVQNVFQLVALLKGQKVDSDSTKEVQGER
jgi:hypothetical protein